MPSAAAMTPVLSCRNLWKSFGGVHALAGLSLEFPASGIVAIVGPNGAGKTTLFNVITGNWRADAGRCRLGSRDITNLAPHRIARLGIARTFQELRLIFALPAVANVLLAMENPRGESLLGGLWGAGRVREEANRGEATGLLRSVGLGAATSTPAGALSYGQQKLLSLACCLGQKGGILLLDEPMAGVHPQMIAQITEAIRAIGRSGRLVVFIEHNLGSVLDVADHVVVLDQGRMLAEGKPDVVLARPEILDAYVR
jgi:ABC-type branched-subunit amino acid transport system ATPase component